MWARQPISAFKPCRNGRTLSIERDPEGCQICSLRLLANFVVVVGAERASLVDSEAP